MQYRVTRSELAGIKQSGPVSEQSILNLFEDAQAPYLIEDQKINGILRTPDYVAQLTLVNNHTFFDLKMVYKENESISVVQDGTDYLIESPADLNSIMTGVQMYMGNSILMPSEMDVKLKPEDANLFAWIIDFMRYKKGLLGTFDNSFSEADIRHQKGLKENENSLAAYVHKATNREEIGSFDALERCSLIKKKGDSYQLIDEALNLAQSFTTIDNYLNVEAIAEANTGFSAIQSGLYTVLYVEKSDHEIRLMTLAPMIIQELMEELLVKNVKLTQIRPQKKENETAQVQRSKKFCTQCGAKLQNASRFCGNCGSKL